MKLFDLSKGDRFELGGNKFTVVGWIKKFMPTLGKMNNLKTIGDDGKTSLFITNFEVKPTTKKTSTLPEDHDINCAVNADPEDTGVYGCTCGFDKITDNPELEKCEHCGNTPETGACYYCKMD